MATHNDEYASDSVGLPIGSLDQTIVRNGDGTVNYFQIVYRGQTYRKTFGYTSGAVTSISRWVKQ